MELTVIQRQMVEEFQCPGCMHGSNTTCGSFKPIEDFGFACGAHRAATFASFAGRINLGLPKGFNRVVYHDELFVGFPLTNIRLFEGPREKIFNRFNVAVWAMEKDGYLFVRTYSPRLDKKLVHVIRGGTIAEMCPGAINVAEFVDEID